MGTVWALGAGAQQHEVGRAVSIGAGKDLGIAHVAGEVRRVVGRSQEQLLGAKARAIGAGSQQDVGVSAARHVIVGAIARRMLDVACVEGPNSTVVDLRRARIDALGIIGGVRGQHHPI